MTELQNKWFVNQGNQSVSLRRLQGYRQSVMVYITNHASVDLTPSIGLSEDGVTLAGTHTGDTLVPLASGTITIPAEDANGVLFDELYLLLQYSYSGNDAEVEIGLGLEYQIMQARSFVELDYHGDTQGVLRRSI